MPIQQLEDQTGGLGSILGMVGGYLATNPARKTAEQKRDFEQKRETASDQRAATELAGNVQEQTDKHAASVSGEDALKAKTLAHQQESQVIGSEPKYDANSPNEWLGWAMKASHYYATSDSEYSKQLGEQARYGANPLKQEASAGLDKAKAGFTTAWRARGDASFNHAMKLAQQKGASAAQIAGIRAQAQQAVAGANASSRAAVATMNDSERMAATQLVGSYMLAGKSADEATRLMVTDYQQQNANYRTQVQAASKAGTDAPTAPAPMSMTPPSSTSINFSPSITVVPVPQPDGTTKYTVVPVKKPQTKAAPKPPASRPVAATPTPAGVFNLGGLIQSVQHLFGGGGQSAGAPQTKVNPANGKTYYLHSDQKYYLAPP